MLDLDSKALSEAAPEPEKQGSDADLLTTAEPSGLTELDDQTAPDDQTVFDGQTVPGDQTSPVDPMLPVDLDPIDLQKLSGHEPYEVLRPRASLSELFHENTKLGPLRMRAYLEGVEAFLRLQRNWRLMVQPYKLYSLMQRVPLPAPAPAGELQQCIARRRSLRRYSGQPLSLDELSRLCRFGYGRIVERPTGEKQAGEQPARRAVPSGGGLYPLELYVLARRVEGLSPGVYHYEPEEHRLDVVHRELPDSKLEDCLWCDGMELEKSAAVLVLSAVFRRTTMKYQDRGYRMIWLEAGAAMQNLSLLAVSMGLGSCQIGGFYDDVLAQLLGIDGREEAPLAPMLLGRAAGAAEDGEAED